MLHDCPTLADQAQSSVQFDSAESIENLKNEQMINNEAVRSLAESVDRLASAVAEIQTKVNFGAQDPCGKCKNDFLLGKHVGIKHSQTSFGPDNTMGLSDKTDTYNKFENVNEPQHKVDETHLFALR